MQYASSLRSLRSKLIEESTGRSDPAENKGLEGFIPARLQSDVPEETTEDLMAKGANWLSEIKKASLEFKKAYSELRSKSGEAKSPLAEAIKGATQVVGKEQEQEQVETTPEERQESFIRRRSETSPSTYAPKRPAESPIPLDANIVNVLDAIAAVESRGSGDYQAVGPVVKKGAYKGQRAYGRYQVMQGNIGPWTEAAVGRRYSVEEFMASPEVQDAVAAYQLQKSKDKYGTWEDAASVWFSGRPVSKAGNASDGYTTVPEYINKFRRNFVRT